MRTGTTARIAARTDAPVIPDDPDLNRRVAEYLLRQNEITGRFVDAMMAKDAPSMTAIADELAAFKADHRDLADDIAKIPRRRRHRTRDHRSAAGPPHHQATTATQDQLVVPRRSRRHPELMALL